MKIIEDSNMTGYEELCKEFTEQQREFLGMIAQEKGIRDDVVQKLQEAEFTEDETFALYAFLGQAEYGPEWYGLFQEILHKAENADICLQAIEEQGRETPLDFDEVDGFYQESASDYEFISRLKKESEEEEAEAPVESEQETEVEELETEQELEHEIKPVEQEGLYETFYQETMYEKHEVEEKRTDEHDAMMASVIRANNEYKEAKNRMKELERMVNLQNKMLEQYKEKYQMVSMENEKQREDYKILKQEHQKLSDKYEALVSKLTDINHYTLEKVR